MHLHNQSCPTKSPNQPPKAAHTSSQTAVGSKRGTADWTPACVFKRRFNKEALTEFKAAAAVQALTEAKIYFVSAGETENLV